MAPGNRLPYPGLRAFTREESDLFFGRESCVDAMVDRLAATRFLTVLGPSGSGKSSLVRTGLLDALELGLHPWAGSHWRIADMHPGGQPLRNLATALLEAKGSPSDAMDVNLLVTFLGRGPRSVAEWAAGGNLQAGSNLLILVDQFEELFRYGGYAQREEAEAFVALLLESAVAPGAPIHIVITIRSEYIGSCTLIPGLAERINTGLFLTPRMGRDECRAAIAGPAGVMGFKVAPALVNRLLNDLASFAPWEAGQSASELERLSRRADQLPLMQHVLNRLWVRAADDAGGAAVELTLSDYERIGGLSGALDAHGAEVIASLGADRARHVEGVFRALVSGTSLALAVRRPCQLGELVAAAGGSRDDVVAIVEAFRAPDCNFLRTSEPSLADDHVIVDISHESLIRQWTPLREWLEREARDDAAWRRLTRAQERYAQGEGGVLTGLDLHSLRAWWESAKPTPAWASRHGGDFAAVQAFLELSLRTEESRAEAQRRQELRERKRLRFGVAGLAAALTIVTVLGTIAWSQAQAAEQRQKEADRERGIARQSETQANEYARLAKLEKTKAERERESARHSAHLAEQREQEAKRSEERVRQSEIKARKDVDTYLAALEEISNVLYSDEYVSLVGMAPLQSKLMSKLVPYQSKYLAIVAPASIVGNEYRLGVAHEETGEAEQALEYFGEAYSRGLKDIKTLPRGQRPAEALEANVIDVGYRYAWFLLDIGEIKKGNEVLSQLQALAAPYNTRSLTPRLLLAYARLENLKSRYSSDQNRPGSKAESQMALDLVSRAVASSDDAPMDALRLQFTLYDYFYHQLHGAAQEEMLDKACALADRMLKNNPMDRRAISARVVCLQYQAENAGRQGNLATQEERLNLARDFLASALTLVPYEQGLLLSMTNVEADIAQLNSERGNAAAFKDHNLKAKDNFVRALLGRTYFQSSTNQVRALYEWFSRVSFQSRDEEFSFYNDIRDAVMQTLKAFPRAPGFAFVAADASAHLGTLRMNDPLRTEEAIGHLSDAIAIYENSRIFEDPYQFTEDTQRYCELYKHRSSLYAAAKNVDRMLSDVEKMASSCASALDRYPWDFYLRDQFLANAKRAGTLLSELDRDAEAVSHLEYVSHWGDAGSTRLLARAYREGLGVPPDEQRARQLDALAQRQGLLKRFTLNADFNGIKSPFFVWVREWPADYPYLGVDDQLEWLKEARAGTVAPEVGEAFRELHKIARNHEVPFPELCAYALGLATQKSETGVTIDGKLFDMVGAVLLMSQGSYQTITGVLRRQPELEVQLNSLGSMLLDHDVKPDMVMVQKLRDIYERYLQKQKQEEEAKDDGDNGSG